MLTFNTAQLIHPSQNLINEFRYHKGKYIFQGAVFVLGGIFAAILPAIMVLNIGLIIGAVLLVTGIIQLLTTLFSIRHKGSLLSALLSITAGALIVWQPLGALMAFVTLLALFMTFEGILEIIIAMQLKPMRAWSWMLVSGIITLILAIILWSGFPSLGIIYIGWVMAINLFLYGISLLMLVWKLSV